MRGTVILIFFFLIFLVTSLLTPSMFPGNLICVLLGASLSQYAGLVSAFLNGAFYAVVIWILFVILSRKLEEEK